MTWRLALTAFIASVLASAVTSWLLWQPPPAPGPDACAWTASGLVTPAACSAYMRQHGV